MEAKLSPEVLAYLQGIFALTPCHTTGEHDPRHTPRYICSLQKADAFDRGMEALGITPGRRLHDECYWCRHTNNAERIKELEAWVRFESCKPASGTPTRLVTEPEGYARPPVAGDRYDVVFHRADGWSLAAPARFRAVAECMWKWEHIEECPGHVHGAPG